jgi:hypothetical protein
MATSKLYRPHCMQVRKTPPCPLAGRCYAEAAGGARGILISKAGRSPQGARNGQVWRPHGTRFAPRHRTSLSRTLTHTFRRSTIRSRLAGRLPGRPLAWKNIVLGRLLALHQRSIKNRVSLLVPSQLPEHNYRSKRVFNLLLYLTLLTSSLYELNEPCTKFGSFPFSRDFLELHELKPHVRQTLGCGVLRDVARVVGWARGTFAPRTRERRTASLTWIASTRCAPGAPAGHGCALT